MVGVASLGALVQGLPLDTSVLRCGLETTNVTEKLLHALLRFAQLPPRDENERTRIQAVAALARSANALAAEAALILKGFRLALGHTI